ncbi:acyltransferase domain-containing protein [Kitasatospora sp. NPDC002551]|uniref:acyltransferase domain-containing protein n=1 Tax=Kitasatospora sp. NPDC002551 TaxID=3154539 RepID=UPI00332A0555
MTSGMSGGQSDPGGSPVLVKVSGAESGSLRAAAGRLADFVAATDGITPEQVAWAAGVGRADLGERAAVVAQTRTELTAGLRAVALGGSTAGVVTGRRGVGTAPRVAFVVPGHGAKVAGVLEGLYGTVPVVTETVDAVAAVVGPVTELPLSALLSGGEEARQALAATEVAQPALYTAAVALGAWWRSVGVEPAAVVGHSVGAYAAAALAGVFTVADGARLTAARGRLMAELPAGGAMVALSCAPQELAGIDRLVSGEVGIAALNGPRDTVISGPLEAVTAVADELAGRGVRGVRLAVPHAFHSAAVEPVLASLAEEFAGLTMSLPGLPLVSDATGLLAGEEITTAEYWVRHTREPVRFEQAMRTVWERGVRILVELGTGGLLGPAAGTAPGRAPVCVPSAFAAGPAHHQLLGSLARLWTEGCQVDWRAVGPRPARTVKLPTYPFQRQDYGPAPVTGRSADRHAGLPPLPAPAAPAALVPASRPEPAPRALPAGAPATGRSVSAQPAPEELVRRLKEELATLLDLADPDELDAETGLFDLGLTSEMVVGLRVRMEDLIDRDIPATAVFDHPTIGKLAGYLAGRRLRQAPAPQRPAADATPRPAAADAAEQTEPAPRPAAPAPAAPHSEPIAIVGMGCRLPGGANDLDTFWQLLLDGRDATGEVPDDRWDREAFYDADPAAPGKTSTRRGGFLTTRVDEFDADAFGISAREARGMDPQQRLLLEVASEALADAGVTAAEVDGSRTSVYVGINTSDYLQLLVAEGTADDGAHLATGNTFSVAAGRLSYLLGAQGPSLAVDTACSSSLVAAHLAVRSLRSGESDLSVVAGVNLMLAPATTAGLSRLRALSPDGRCKTFDASADGYGRGEGAGVVVLKRLSDAQAAGDHIWAVLRGTAVNQDGRSAGLTVPNGLAQQAVIQDALRDAGASPDEVGYVEAHGTGTALGDPMEIQALAEALRPEGGDAPPLVVGSAKTNVGHLEAAAGICGLVKVALSLYHGQIPPHLHLENPNPLLDWAALPVTVPTELTPWTTGGRARVAGLSSFGFSGTNAHVVLEQAPEPRPADRRVDEPADERPELLVLSARTPEGLRETAEAYRTFLADGSAVRGRSAWAETVRTAAVRRDHFAARMALVASSPARAAEQLDKLLAGGRHQVRQGVVPRPARSRLVFVYGGQGSQWPGMGRSLLADPVAARVLLRCEEVVRELAGWSLLEQLEAPREASRLDDTSVTQPAIFAVEAALTELWRSWGVEPDAVVGHSVGEIAAAVAAGAFGLEEGLRIAVLRGRVMARSHGQGRMAVVGLPVAEVRTLIEPYGGRLFVAAVNSPVNTVVGGLPQEVAALEAQVRERKAFWMAMPGEYAFHTPVLDPLRGELVDALGALAPAGRTVPLYSTVTGGLAGPDALDARYWADNMTLPVRFADALQAAAGEGHTLVVEAGPHAVLSTAVRQSLEGRVAGLTTAASMRAGAEARATMLDAAGALHVAGRPVDHRALHGEGPSTAALPAYRWQRQRYWLPGKPVPHGQAPDALAQDVYEVDWERVEPPVLEPGTAGRPQGTWLLIEDQHGLAGRVAERLAAHGARARILTVAEPGTAAAFCRNGPDRLRELVARALAEEPAVRGLVHLGALHDAADPRLPGPELDGALALACGPLLFAPKVLRARPGAPAPQLWVVTRGGVGTDGAAMAASHAPAWGLGRAVALEHPEIWGGLVDLDPAGADPGQEAEAIAAELLAPDGEDQVAYRAGLRKAARLRRVENLPATPAPTAVGPDGSYLITGGRGILGLRVARWLAGRGARHLVLLGRRPVPEDGPGLPESDRQLLAALAELRAAGVSVHTPHADVADAAAMAGVFDTAANPWPAVKGVVHAAGLFEPRAVVDLDWQHFRDILRPKVEGSLVLDALTAAGGVDFFVMFSSASSVWGSALAGHYVAANYFQDVLAHDRVSRGLPGLAMNWGWWEESEMAGHHEQYFESMGLYVLPNETGLAALGRTLGSGRHQLTVAPVDWARFRPVMEAKRRRPLLTHLGTRAAAGRAGGDAMLLGRLRQAESRATRTRLLERALQAEVAAVLGREPGSGIDADLGFFEAGMDSVMSVELKFRLEQLVGEELPGTVAFEHPTVAALGEYLLGEVLGLADPLPERAAEVDELSAELAQLSESELLDLLESELNQESHHDNN